MRIPPATQALLWALGLAFLAQNVAEQFAFLHLTLWPLGEFPVRLDDGAVATAHFRPWQLLTYIFLHGNFAHLFFNAFALFQFGSAIEQVFGARRFLVYFFACGIGAGVLQVLVALLYPAGAAPVIGASGAMYGVLFAYGMLFPNQRLMLLLPPIPMKAKTMVWVFGGLELLLGLSGAQPGIAHFVHLGGMLFGWLLLRYWRRDRTRRPPSLPA
jgi:membrane associated rhomboid family serine protease